MITFKANYIDSATVHKKTFLNSYEDFQVSFVELDPYNQKDVLCLNETNINWRNGNTFASDMTRKINELANGKRNIEENRFFALTTQTDNFENLSFKKILGLTSVYKQHDNSAYIRTIQVAPDFQYCIKNRDFKHIGSELVNKLLRVISEKTIYLDTTEAGKKLYLTKGFKDFDCFGRMILKR